MAKMTMGKVAAVLSVGITALMQTEIGPFGTEGESVRDLLLNGAGTRTPRPGQVRIPILVDGAAYELFIAKPGEPKVSPLARNDAD